MFANEMHLFWSQGSDVDDEDMKELLNDTRLLKKLKKGKITEEDFDRTVSAGGSLKRNKSGPSHESSSGEEDA